MTQLFTNPFSKYVLLIQVSLFGTKRPVDILRRIEILFVSFQGLLGRSTRPKPSFTRFETITVMDTLKKT